MTWHDMTWKDMTWHDTTPPSERLAKSSSRRTWGSMSGRPGSSRGGRGTPARWWWRAPWSGPAGPGSPWWGSPAAACCFPYASLFDLFIFRMLWACGSKIRIILVQNCTVNTSVMTYCIAEGEASLCDINDHWSMMIIASFIDNFTHFNVLSLL